MAAERFILIPPPPCTGADRERTFPRNRCTDLDGASFAHGLPVRVSVEP